MKTYRNNGWYYTIDDGWIQDKDLSRDIRQEWKDFNNDFVTKTISNDLRFTIINTYEQSKQSSTPSTRD